MPHFSEIVHKKKKNHTLLEKEPACDVTKGTDSGRTVRQSQWQHAQTVVALRPPRVLLHALSGHFVRENPPITWQRVDAFRHAGWLQFKAASDCARKGDSSDSQCSEQGLWEPDWLQLRVLHNLLLISWDSHPITSVSGVDRVPEVAVVWRKKKNALLMSGVGGQAGQMWL